MFGRLKEIASEWLEIEESNKASEVAYRLVHGLHFADATLPDGRRTVDSAMLSHMADDILDSAKKLRRTVEECGLSAPDAVAEQKESDEYFTEVFGEEIAAVKRARKLIDENESAFDECVDLNEENARLKNQITALRYRLAKAEGRTDEAEDIFEGMRRDVDSEGWLRCEAAEHVFGVTSNRVYSEFYYEDVSGVFDAMGNGESMIPYIERCTHFYRIKDSEFIGPYERCEYELDPEMAEEYESMQKKVDEEYEKIVVAAMAAA